MEKIKLRLLETFSGIGSQFVGLEQTNLYDVESVGTCDLDKEVVVSYAAMHCGLTNEMIKEYNNYPSKEEMIKELIDKRLGYDFKNDKSYDWEKLAKKKDITKGIEKYWLADKLSKNLGDITQVQEFPDCDFLTYSSCCQDLSIAGQQAGLDWTCKECGTKYNPADYDLTERYKCPNCGSEHILTTRSGLLYEIERLLSIAKEKNKLPSYLLCENVDALVSKKFKPSFLAWLETLESIGYNTYWTCLNAKHCGVPQNRNRLIALSIRKDIDTGKFEFPKPFDTGLRLRDLLETDNEILDKYFLSDEVQSRLEITDPDFVKSIVGTTKPDFRTIGQRDVVYQKDGIMGALVATDYKQPKQVIENEQPILRGGMQSHQSVKTDGISTCLTSSMGEGGGYVPIIGEKYKETNDINVVHSLKGVMPQFDNSFDTIARVYGTDGISPTLDTMQGGHRQPKIVDVDNNHKPLRVVRKLTPKECHRLMGFPDQFYKRCANIGMSDTQGYKQAGNSIVTSVISLVAEHLYKAQYDENYKCFDENFTNPQES